MHQFTHSSNWYPRLSTLTAARPTYSSALPRAAMAGPSSFANQYFDKGDVKLTSNLCWHAKMCWGEETVTLADNTRNANTAHEALSHNPKLDGSITSVFQHMAKGNIMYSHRQHTKLEAWHVIFLFWASESTSKILFQYWVHTWLQRVNGHSRLWTTVASTPLWRWGDWNIIFPWLRLCCVMSEMSLWWEVELCYGCLDLTKSQGVRHCHHPLWAHGEGDGDASGYSQSLKIAQWSEPCEHICQSPKWLWDQ